MLNLSRLSFSSPVCSQELPGEEDLAAGAGKSRDPRLQPFCGLLAFEGRTITDCGAPWWPAPALLHSLPRAQAGSTCCERSPGELSVKSARGQRPG